MDIRQATEISHGKADSTRGVGSEIAINCQLMDEAIDSGGK